MRTTHRILLAALAFSVLALASRHDGHDESPVHSVSSSAPNDRFDFAKPATHLNFTDDQARGPFCPASSRMASPSNDGHFTKALAEAAELNGKASEPSSPKRSLIARKR